MPSNILVIAPALLAEPVADALRLRLDIEVDLVSTTRAAMASLRRNPYGVILLDDGLTAADHEAADQLYKTAAGSLLIEINFVLSNAERIVRQVRYALIRREQDRAHAHTAIASRLNSELNSTLAGLLLESELALREASPAQQPKLRHVVELAATLRNQLRPNA